MGYFTPATPLNRGWDWHPRGRAAVVSARPRGYPAAMLTSFLTVMGVTTAAMLVGAGVLHLVPRLGAAGKRASAALCRAPGLDVVITYFTVAPLIAGPVVAGWAGLAGGVAGQVAGMLVWQFAHEMAHPEARRGPRVVKYINRIAGRWRNHTAVWLTATVTPLFWVVRVAQVLVYPPITWLVKFPKYDAAEWVNVSRHKFDGLVGHDRIWCLYCDWMTGVWSLGSEMLRNVESYWCPIRFDSIKKCANCSVDFPDLEHGWVPAGATMRDVTATLERMYPPNAVGPRAWFGHPARLTVRGRELDPATDGSNGNGNGAATAVAEVAATVR